MSKNNIAGLPTLHRQRGFSITGYLASIVVAGVVTVSMLPAIHDIVDSGDYNALSHARATLMRVMEINYQASRIQGGKSIEIEGQQIPLRFGYPFADARSLRSFATFDGFDIDELEQHARIWSPGRLFCMTYQQASLTTGKIDHPVLSEIYIAAEGGCGI